MTWRTVRLISNSIRKKPGAFEIAGDSTAVGRKQLRRITPLRFQIWDVELRQNIQPLEKNLQIIRVLLPVTYAAAALISAGLAVFLSFLQLKNAAILRVLGVSRRNTARVLVLSGMLAVITGCLVGVIATAVLTPEGIVGSQLGVALYLAGSLIRAVLGAVLVTRQRPLELLQTKE